MAAAGPLEVGVQGVLEAIQAACAELAGVRDFDKVAEAALGLALALTKSSVAFIGIADETGAYEPLYSRAIDAAKAPTRAEAQKMIAAATASSDPSICGLPLRAGGESIGVMGVTRDFGYTSVERQAFAILANQAASSLHVAQLRMRRQEMVSALVNLRADVESSEKQRLATAERAQSAERVERAHELAVEALLAVSVHASTGRSLSGFYKRLSKSVAGLVGADKVLFWQLQDDGTLTAIPGGYGVDAAFISRLYPIKCSPEQDDLQSRVVFKDFIYRAAAGDKSSDSDRVLEFLGVTNAISVPWRAGNQRLGLVAAYDSTRPDGFSREDTWVLQKAGLAAGLVWQLKLAEGDLKQTVERLQRVDAARQLLLKSVSSAVDNERKRFASELHDDALQKLTAVELQLQRLAQADRPDATILAEAQRILGQTEDALRRLLFDVRPPALDSPGGLEQSVRDRLAMLRSVTGIAAELEMELPDGLHYEFRSLVFRQLAEALANVEKHARATQVQVRLATRESGVHGVVVDDGQGFVVAEKNNLPGHLGLLALKERSLMAGGWYKIESQPGLGTRIEFWIPIA